MTKSMHLTFYLMVHLSMNMTVECAPDGTFEGTLTFEVEIKCVLDVTVELHLKMQMVVHLLV